jgi:nucleotide-binding universal stress UspA family protein
MYQRILVPFDGSATSGRGLQEAIKLAQLTKGRLKLVYVVDELALYMAAESYATVSGDYLSMLIKDGEQLLVQARSSAEAAGVQAETMLCDNFKGSVCDVVIGEAASWPADIIVLGTHGRRGIGRALMGSSAEKILRHASVPVLLVRAPEDKVAKEPAIHESAGLAKVNMPSAALHIE